MNALAKGEVDVLVVGAGLAGHCAALSAREAGASVLLVEKMADYGGSSLMSGASFAFAGTSQQKDQGIEDTPELLREDLLEVGGHKNDPALVELYVDNQLDTYGWLKRAGVEFHPVQLSSNMSAARGHPTFPRQVFDVLHPRLAEAGIEYAAGTAAKALRADAAGKVRDVELSVGGEGRKLRVDRGIVLTTGGFARSDDLVQKFVPDQAPALRYGGEGSTGDGIRMAWALGADVADVGYVKATFGIAMPDFPGSNRRYDGERPLLHAMYRGGIIVNREARRFISEANSYKTLGDASLKQPGALGFQIFDQNIMDQSIKTPKTHDYAGALELGVLRQADSIAGLAREVGLDPDTLVETVDRYNASVDAGGDRELGRMTLAMGVGKLVRLDRAPFYIFPCAPSLFTTYGGLKVNERLEVVHVEGHALAGLYAAGEVMGGFHGKGYMSGSANGKCAVFGRISGRNAALSDA
ncbi:MAG: FAD-dependent oxidoreductase [Flavobacteriaceae bacterium]